MFRTIFKVIRLLSFDAVSGCEDPLRIDEGTSTDITSTRTRFLKKVHLPGKFIWWRLSPADDPTGYRFFISQTTSDICTKFYHFICWKPKNVIYCSDFVFLLWFSVPFAVAASVHFFNFNSLWTRWAWILWSKAAFIDDGMVFGIKLRCNGTYKNKQSSNYTHHIIKKKEW